MKKFYVGLVAITILCFSFALAGADTIIDTGSSAYWGGAVHNATSTAYGDVIGSPYFNVDSMTVTRLRKQLDCRDCRTIFRQLLELRCGQRLPEVSLLWGSVY